MWLNWPPMWVSARIPLYITVVIMMLLWHAGVLHEHARIYCSGVSSTLVLIVTNLVLPFVLLLVLTPKTTVTSIFSVKGTQLLVQKYSACHLIGSFVGGTVCTMRTPCLYIACRHKSYMMCPLT